MLTKDQIKLESIIRDRELPDQVCQDLADSGGCVMVEGHMSVNPAGLAVLLRHAPNREAAGLMVMSISKALDSCKDPERIERWRSAFQKQGLEV